MIKIVETKIVDNQKGMVLVMSIMILTLVLTSVLTLSKVILGELRMSVNTGSSVIAFYSAESGIEKGLYYIKYSRGQKDFDDFTSLSSKGNSGTYPVDDLGARTFNIATSTIFGDVKDFYNVATSSPVHLDIIDPSGEVGTIDWSTTIGLPKYYQVFWEIEDCFPTHASDKLEVTINSFAQEFTNPSTDSRILICNCAYWTDECDGYGSADISPNRYYHFTFRPLDSEVKEVNFRMVDYSYYPLSIMSSALIESYGQYGNSRYRLQATIPTFVPTSHIFSYILFSEEDLTKGLY